MIDLSWLTSFTSCLPCTTCAPKEQIRVLSFSTPTVGAGILIKIPRDVRSVFVEVIGAGGGGSFLPSDVSLPAIFGSGGGSGAYSSSELTVVPGTFFRIQVGLGGTGGTSSSFPGTNGGDSSFVGEDVNIVGGGGKGAPGPQGGMRGVASGGKVNFNGQSGQNGGDPTLVSCAGMGGGSPNGSQGGFPGSFVGGTGFPGQVGSAPGAGGGGGWAQVGTQLSAGNGANGLVRIFLMSKKKLLC